MTGHLTATKQYVKSKITDDLELYGLGAWVQGAGIGWGIAVLLLAYQPAQMQNSVIVAFMLFMGGMLLEARQRQVVR